MSDYSSATQVQRAVIGILVSKDSLLLAAIVLFAATIAALRAFGLCWTFCSLWRCVLRHTAVHTGLLLVFCRKVGAREFLSLFYRRAALEEEPEIMFVLMSLFENGIAFAPNRDAIKIEVRYAESYK